MKEMKIFISQPIHGRSDEDIRQERDMVMEKLREKYGEDAPVTELHSLFKAGTDLSALSCLGRSLELMGQADAAVFCQGWQDARGCRLENMCAVEYGVPIITVL